jgi:GST-like protein
MAGQANHFLNYAKEDLTYPKQRYTDEVHRLFGVMNTRLAKRKYLAGAYSIADMASLSWVKSSTRFQPLDEFPALAAWFERLMKRPAVQRGLKAGAELRKPQPLSDEEHKILFGQRARS